MKASTSVIIYLLFNFHSFAEGMPTSIFKVLQKEDQSSKEAHCHQNTNEEVANFSSGMPLHMQSGPESISTTIQCRSVCNDNSSGNPQVNKTFNTSELNMSRGDGNMWASLSTTLKYWSEEVCIEKGNEYCKTRQGLKDFEVVSVSSGDWSTTLNFTCSKTQPQVTSPFEPSLNPKRPLNLDRTFGNALSNNPVPVSSVRLFDWLTYNHGFNRAPAPAEGCGNQIKATFCYGDCITLDDRNTQLLASANPLGSDEISLCVDDLVSHLRERNITSPSLIKHYCETYFLNFLKSNRTIGLSCSSSRFDIDCSSIAGLL